MYVSNISNLQVIPIWVANSMSNPLDFPTEGPGFEFHQGHMFFVVVFFFFFILFFKIEISTHSKHSIAIERKNDGQRTLSEKELDWPSWRVETKVQHHMYAVFKCIAFQLP